MESIIEQYKRIQREAFLMAQQKPSTLEPLRPYEEQFAGGYNEKGEVALSAASTRRIKCPGSGTALVGNTSEAGVCSVCTRRFNRLAPNPAPLHFKTWDSMGVLK